MKQRSFCGDACRVAWWNTHRDVPGRGASQRKVCPHCGREFVSYGKTGKTFCGHPCFIAHRFARGGACGDAGAV
jgi:hypothetical protein